ncbi:hypothetical protein D5S18_02630 [Nocardia panacis]|uniref:Uncharacterized protein n=1 Tax=Nocardia panacis TaxID=2340916 RepID=A0A3A4KI10_9NOCA|nr:hypothetical protein [Nocardia panacis]RJO79249.1 hypothetical protein D5S18_02630 [Nocardia panacis]
MNIAQNADAAGLPRLLESPGHGLFLKYDIQNVADDHAVNAIALRAIFDFAADFCRPLLIGVSTAYWEDDFDWPMSKPIPHAPYQTLYSTETPESVRLQAIWDGEEFSPAAELTYETATRFMCDAVASDPSGVRMNWHYLWVRASMARLPADSTINPDGTISVLDRIWTLEHPVEFRDGAHWVGGPLRNTVAAPIAFQLGRQFFELSLNISVHWSIWTPGGAGHDRVREGIAALLAAGWTMPSPD